MNQNIPAILILGQHSLTLARQIQTLFPQSQIYGLKNRTENVDISYDNFGETLQQLFQNNTPIIGICATGILIRTIAPLLTNKWQEPPILAVAEDGSAVVPLLGGVQGVNHLARQIAQFLNISPAITGTGDIRFQTALLSPPTGYHLANPEDAKTFISDILAGAPVQLIGNAPWLRESKINFTADAQHFIYISETALTGTPHALVYHPQNIIITIIPNNDDAPETLSAAVYQLLNQQQLSPHSLAQILTLNTHLHHPAIRHLAETFKLPVRYFYPTELDNVHTGSLLNPGTPTLTIHSHPLPEVGHRPGHLFIVGFGPGATRWISPEVREALNKATDWLGYTTYLNLVEPLRTHQIRHDFDNREEIARAEIALNLAATGKNVALISSGDSGIFAMSAAVLEVLEKQAKPEWLTVDIQICPGISAMQAAASLIGAPLGHDFCVMSLSDILKPWEIIEKRLHSAAEADFVMAFYNPISKYRPWQLGKAKEILLKYRSAKTPVILAKNVGRKGQSIAVCSLENFWPENANMGTIILVGSSLTRTFPRPDGGVWVYTPRSYLID